MNRLAPVSEEPVTSEEDDTNSRSKRRTTITTTNNNSSGNNNNIGRHCSSSSKRSGRQSLKYWLKSLPLLFQKKSSSLSDLRTLLSVISCPLFPASIHPKLSSFNQVSSSAQYIIQHFTAATGCRKLEGRVKNIFATGKVTMRMTDHDHLAGLGGGGGGSIGTIAEKGCFVMWQMVPNKWLIELVLGGHKVVAGSDGNVAWRHTPWLGAHTAKGGLRPLRRAIQASSRNFTPYDYFTKSFSRFHGFTHFADYLVVQFRHCVSR
ncbi:hypothetical protein LINPERPRIM_LOCUS16458 [Linum perenne]